MKGKQRPHARINQIKGSSVPVSEPAAAAHVQRCEQRQQCNTTTLLVCDSYTGQEPLGEEFPAAGGPGNQTELLAGQKRKKKNEPL